MTTAQRLSAKDRANLAAMLESPERLEVHGKDRAWRAGLLGAVLSAAALSFTATPAHAQYQNMFTSIAAGTAASALGSAIQQGISGAFDGAKKLASPSQNPQNPPQNVAPAQVPQPQVQQFTNQTGQPYVQNQNVPVQQGQVVSTPAFVSNGLDAAKRTGSSLAAALGIPGATPDIPTDAVQLKAVMERDQVLAIADTSPLRPVMFPIVLQDSSTQAEQFAQAAAQATSMVPAGPNGQAIVRDGLARGFVPNSGPTAAVYVGEGNTRGACMILMHSGSPGSAQQLAQTTGMSMKDAIDFSVVREAAICAQQGESLATLYDWVGGKQAQARTRMAFSGLIDVHTEAVINSADPKAIKAINKPDLNGKSLRSTERYADAFAALSMNAARPLTDQQWRGVATYRMYAAQDPGHSHDNADFMRIVEFELQRNPAARDAMRSPDGASFNASAVAAFLKPIWHTYEARERDAELAQERAGSARQLRQTSQRSADPESGSFSYEVARMAAGQR